MFVAMAHINYPQKSSPQTYASQVWACKVDWFCEQANQ